MRVYLPVLCMVVAAACQLVPTKGNLPLHLYVPWISLLLACYSQASSVGKKCWTTTLEQISKHTMYSRASFWQLSYFLKQVNDHFCYCMFCYGSNCVWHIGLLRSCSSTFPRCSIELLYLFKELMIYGESWMERVTGNH
jgi:hypothetical protein